MGGGATAGTTRGWRRHLGSLLGPAAVLRPPPVGHIAAVDFEDANLLWREGESRLAAADPADRPSLERVTDEILAQLRRRIGGPFGKQELADFYASQSTDWCFEVAIRVAPGTPAAWDLATVAGAAFARYAREARDYRPADLAARPPGMEPD